MFNSARSYAVFQIRRYGQQAHVRHAAAKFANTLGRRQAEESSVVPCHACGQPTATTHPHLIKNREVIPGIRLDELKQRRNKLMQNIISRAYDAASNKSHIIILPSASKSYMSDKIPYVFRQNTDFLYFSGCQEPDSILAITAKNENFTSTMFMRQQDHHSELWDGPRTGVDAAPKIFGVDSALPVTEFQQFFLSFINENEKSTVWYDNVDVVEPNLHRKLCELIKINDTQTFVSPADIIHKIRLIKSQSEIDLMKESCKIISAAISKTMEISKAGMSEHQLFAIVDYQCRMNGAEYLAYPPVVAAGKNANIIHYISNNQMIQDGDMILMDAGCEYHGYSSDVTRTWPINGTFNPEQRTLYNVVLDIQRTLIDRLKGMPSLDQLYHDMCFLLGKKLQEIGLIPKHLSGKELLSAVYTYCPHHVSHYLGMDVHDTGKISRSIKLQPGMIITIEPGIYVNPKNKFALPEFYGLGIRIEDDVLITENGPIILTESCPKEISDIEVLANRNV